MSSSNQPLVSIVAVCYNHGRFVEENLNSIIKQTYKNTELIIIDDCSNDDSVDVIDSWINRTNTDCVFISHQKNCGLIATIKEGASRCRGDYIQLIACDDVLLPAKIKTQIALLEDNKTYGFSCSNFRIIDENSEVLSSSYYPNDYLPPADMFVGILLKKEMMGGRMVVHAPTVLARKQIFDELDNFIDDFDQEDFYLWVNAAFKYEAIFCNDVLVSYRKVNSSLSRYLNRNFETSYKRCNDHIIVIDNLIPKAKGERLKALLKAKLNRIQRIEQLYIEYKYQQKDKCKDMLKYCLKSKNDIKQLCPELERDVVIAHTKTIINLWKKGEPVYQFYKQYEPAVPLFYRLVMKMPLFFFQIIRQVRASLSCDIFPK